MFLRLKYLFSSKCIFHNKLANWKYLLDKIFNFFQKQLLRQQVQVSTEEKEKITVRRIFKIMQCYRKKSDIRPRSVSNKEKQNLVV